MRRIIEILRKFFKRHYLGILIVSLTFLLEFAYFYVDYRIHGNWFFARHLNGLGVFAYFIIFFLFAFVLFGGFISDRGRLKRIEEMESLRKMNFIENVAIEILSEPSFERKTEIAVKALNKLVPYKELYVIVNSGEEYRMTYPCETSELSEVTSKGVSLPDLKKFAGKFYKGYYISRVTLYDLTGYILFKPVSLLTRNDRNILEKYRKTLEPLFNNARLIIALKESKSKIEKLLGRYKFMHRFSLKLQSAGTPEEVYWTTVKIVSSFFDADLAFIIDVSESKDKWKFVAVKNVSQKLVKFFEDKFAKEETGIVSEVMREKKPVFIDYSVNNRFLKDLRAFDVGGSWIWIPFVVDESVVAVLAVGTKEKYKFESEDIVFSYMLSDMISSVLVRIRYLEKLDEYSVTDPLTGLYNKREFYTRVIEEIRKSETYGRKLSIVMFDLDGFKEWNDTYGHLEGDKLLKEMGNLLRERLRSTDIPFRFGGDEFVIIMPETSAKSAETAIKHILTSVDELTAGKEKKVTLSIGIAEYRHTESVEKLVERADKAMYIAKNTGKNKIKIADF